MRLICVLIWSESLIVLFLWETSESMQEDTVIHSALKFLEGRSFFFFFFLLNPLKSLCISLFTGLGIIHIFWIIAWMDFYLSLCVGIFSCVWCHSSFQLVCLRHFIFALKSLLVFMKGDLFYSGYLLLKATTYCHLIIVWLRNLDMA